MAGLQVRGNGLQIHKCERDAALCRGEIRRGDMEKYGAAQPSDNRIVIITKHDNKIIQPVMPHQSFMTGGIRQGNGTVITGVGGIVAPAIRFGQGPAWEFRRWFCYTISAVKHPARQKIADRCGTVAFPFVRRNS